jgi:hypothetical protein
MSIGQKLYSVLLRAYPTRLRKECGAEMLQLFSDQLSDAKARGTVKQFYFQTLIDWAKTVLAEHFWQSRMNRQSAHPAPMHRLLRRGLLFAPNPGAAILITAGILGYRGIRKFSEVPQSDAGRNE